MSDIFGRKSLSTYAVRRRLGLSLDIHGEPVARLGDVRVHVMAFMVQASSVETVEADVDPKRLVL